MLLPILEILGLILFPIFMYLVIKKLNIIIAELKELNNKKPD